MQSLNFIIYALNCRLQFFILGSEIFKFHIHNVMISLEGHQLILSALQLSLLLIKSLDQDLEVFDFFL